MNFEKYVRLCEDANKHIKPTKSVTIDFNGDGLENADRLFFTGETAIPYFWKSEPDYQMLYRRIDDSLRCDISEHDRYCLDLSGTRVPYTKIAFKRLTAPFKLSYLALKTFDDNWEFGIKARAEGLKVYGALRVLVEVRYKREGVINEYTAFEPDEVFSIDIPEGSYGITSLSKKIVIDAKNIANVCYFVEGTDYEGSVFFESPTFCNCEGRNLIPQFAPYSDDRPLQNWMGQNLSKIEWVGLKIDINGKNVFDGEVFERCHRFSEWEVTLEKGVINNGNNTITFTCTSDYRDAPGYDLREIGIIVNAPSTVISVPENVTAGKPFAVLVENKKGKEYAFSSKSVRPVCLTCKKDGLNILTFICDTPENDVKFTLDGEEQSVSRCVLRGDDGVITGTGDAIYINNSDIDHKNYLKWYMSNNIGNLLTIRPTYRWSGSRIRNDKMWREFTSLLDEAGISYSHMLDGRELPGGDCNPPKEIIDSPHFLGRQTHEFDGQFCYWGYWKLTGDHSTQMFYDLFVRMYRQFPDRVNVRFTKETLYYKEKEQYVFKDPDEPDDMKTASEAFVNSLIKTRCGNPRHTGPATLFKYFYQAGYEWTGAELMYSPTEITSSVIRGARDLYGGKTGVHHAVQWSSSPHDTESRYRRYRLALFITYIQDIDEINTEEGLWRLEEYYNYHNRFSPACLNHKKQQQDFYRYISTHTRTGKFYTPIAFLSGRYDGWRCFSRGKNTWGRASFGFSEAEAAWDVLTYYYPKSVLNALYVHDCPDSSVGYYSGTPQGNVDVTPIESERFDRYRLLVACGYNCANKEDVCKLTDYVKEGGTLVIGWPQLSVTTKRTDVTEYRHEYIDGKEHIFTEDTYEGKSLSVCCDTEYDEVILYTDGKRPLVVKRYIGDGELYFITAREYAGNAAVDAVYRQVLSIVTPKILEDEEVYAKGDSNVQFTVYNNEDGSKNVYFIATDWHKDNGDGEGTLIAYGNEYKINVPFYELIKVTVKDGYAVYPENYECEVISIADGIATVQGKGKCKFNILNGGEITTACVDFTERAVQTIKL